MAPSRGLLFRLRPRVQMIKPQYRRYSEFVAAAIDPSQKARVFTSQSTDPYLNLSIEHYLLQKSPADSTILFLYANSPCVVIGRNQNPWIEVNLGVLRNGALNANLVRRRSGGGTVFHDEGNVNYSVICPTAAFNRDKHAEMVVRALKSLGADKARVNERHDIVMDKQDKEGKLKPFKVSGSAYKLTRLRSLHHGTCLLSSPNIHSISKYLRAPAKPFIKARGVDSVSSSITNVGVDKWQFREAVAAQFRSMYGIGPEASDNFLLADERAREVPEIAQGLKELLSEDWIYGQTPQFTFSTEKTATTVQAPTTNAWPPVLHGCDIQFTAKYGKLTEVSVEYNGRVNQHINSPMQNSNSSWPAEMEIAVSTLLNKDLHKISDWEEFLPRFSGPDGEEDVDASPGMRMNQLFGVGNYETSVYLR